MKTKDFPAVIMARKIVEKQAERYVEMIGKTAEITVTLEDVIQTLQQEWYDLNSQAPPTEETPRELGIRIGRKAEVVKLIHILKNRYETNP